MSFETQIPQASERGSDGKKEQMIEPVHEENKQSSVPDLHQESGEEELRVKLGEAFTRGEQKKKEMSEKEQMAKAIKLLRKIDRQMVDVDSRLQSRQKLFGGRFIQGSRLKQKGEALLQERKVLATDTFVSFLERYSLDPIPFLRAVEKGGPIWKFADRLQENISIIEELESTLPGACGRLSRDYGIRNFSRYPQRILLEQLEGENDTETPYGLALYSQNDWNNALNSTSHLDLEELDEETKKVGLRMRIIECIGLVDAAKRLISLDRRYGEYQKIQFAVVAAHGGENGFELGSQSLEVETLPENALKKIAGFFTENPTVILNACSTGKEESGIANTLAQVTNAEVIATGYQPIGLEIQSIDKTDTGYKFHTVFESPSLFGMWTRREKPKSFSKNNEIKTI